MAQPVNYYQLSADEETTFLFGLRALATVLPNKHPQRELALKLEAELAKGIYWFYKAVPPEDKPDDRS
jgi:hypothetical protein